MSFHGWDVKVKTPETIPSSIFNFGYPQGSIISLTGVAKAGKTTFALQESMVLSATEGYDVLYIYNESPTVRFMKIAHEHRKKMGFSIDELKKFTFFNMHGSVLSTAKFEGIDKFIQAFLVNPIIGWANKRNNPGMVVIDSFTKIIRTFPAQAYYAAQSLTGQLHKKFSEIKKYPVVLMINQKSGDRENRNDESVLGGYGIVHETDGSIVMRLQYIDKWNARDLNLKWGSIIHTIQVYEMRDGDYDNEEYMLLMEEGTLVLGDRISDIYIKSMEARKNEQ